MNLKSSQEISDAVEEVDKRVIARADVFGRLIVDLRVKRGLRRRGRY